MPIPCPHFKITIVKRSQGQSAVAGAAYQSGERLFSEYDQKTKFYNKKKELVHAEIMLPPNAPPGYADRATLWNAVEAVENQWNSQLARRIVLAFPVEVPKEQYLKMIREFCQEQFVSKGMIADFAIHDKGDGNPHAHILLTLRAMDEHGKWLPKARKVYDLDENGERIQLPSGNWKCHKENTVDWNDQKYAEVWRHSWEVVTNRYLEAAGRPERVDLRSFERQGIQQIPTVHLGPAAHQMEKRGVETFLGNLNRDIRAANSLMQSIRSAIRGLQHWIADLNEKKQLLLDALEKAKEPTLSDLLVDYFDLRNEQRSDWSAKAKLKCSVRDFEEVKQAVDYLKAQSLNTVEDLNQAIDSLNQTAAPLRKQLKQNENRMNDFPDEDIKASQAKLNAAYDAFTAKYGLINDKKNARLFDDDSSYYLLCSLENLDENKNLKSKADMFTKRTIRPERVVTSVDTPSEALAVSIGEHGKVDLPYMAELLGTPGNCERITTELVRRDFQRPCRRCRPTRKRAGKQRTNTFRVMYAISCGWHSLLRKVTRNSRSMWTH